MKFIQKYQAMGINTQEEALNYLLSTLKDTIRTYDFFVAWDKVLGNVSQIEISLNILNSLIGKSNIKTELKALIKQYPEVVPVIPFLTAVRDTTIKIADVNGDIEYSFKPQKSYSENEIDNIVNFADKCGFLAILADKNIKNLVDYAVGVEVGLDTNARKNRSGTTMESLIEFYVNTICKKYGYRYLAQATANQIQRDFNISVPTDKADRHFDFAISTGSKVYLLEVNYYGGGGSKLKSVAGEFKSLFELINNHSDIGFIWITDGMGWLTAIRPLTETFNEIDFTMNIKMINDGLLEHIISNGL